jgi:CheY-specific phosphatase CheX
MADRRRSTINEVAEFLSEAVKEVLETNTGSKIKIAPTLQKISNVALRPDIGCFVEFSGDYNGLLCMNFTKEASLELYIKAMKTLGLPEEEIAKSYLAEEVANFIGEMVNQIIGNFRRKIEKKYGLIGKNNQPKAIVISRTIIMYVDTFLQASQNRKISFRTEEGSQFYAELSLEQTEFIPLKSAEGEAEEPSVEDLLKEFF